MLLLGAFESPVSELETWLFVRDSLLPDTFIRTLKLVFLTLLGTSFIALPLAIIMEFADFPLKKQFDLLLYLPLAFPLYVLAFIYIGIFEWSAPLPTSFRSMGADVLGNISVKNIYGMSFVFSIGLFPYLLIPLRFTLRNIPQSLWISSLSLGRGGSFFLWHIVSKLSFPAFMSGLTIITMEVLADFGAVSTFNVDTLSTAIYTAWTGLFSLASAVKISSLLLIISLVIYGLNTKFNSDSAVESKVHGEILFKTSKGTKFCIFFFVFTILCLSVFIPIFQLFFWLLSSDENLFSMSYFSLLGNTFRFAFIGAVFTCLLSLMFSFFERNFKQSFLIQSFKGLSLLGYALPGALCAMAVYFFSKSLEGYITLPLTFLLIFGLVFRFLSVSYRTIHSSVSLMDDKLELSSRSLGRSTVTYLRRIWFPYASKSLGLAFVFGFVEIAKEMPITLMLRPLGEDTLATKLYEYTTEGEWERAAAASLALILLTLLSILIAQFTRRKYA